MSTDPAEPSASLVDVHWGVAYALQRLSTGIGRGDTNPILVRDPAASRNHAEIQRDGTRFVLHPIGNAQTCVNGIPIRAPHALAEGDEIEIAYTRFRFTRRPPGIDLMPAPEHPLVDPALSGQQTQIREILTRERISQLRAELLRPPETHWKRRAAVIAAGALLLALLIRLLIRLISG